MSRPCWSLRANVLWTHIYIDTTILEVHAASIFSPEDGGGMLCRRCIPPCQPARFDFPGDHRLHLCSREKVPTQTHFMITHIKRW